MPALASTLYHGRLDSIVTSLQRCAAPSTGDPCHDPLRAWWRICLLDSPHLWADPTVQGFALPNTRVPHQSPHRDPPTSTIRKRSMRIAPLCRKKVYAVAHGHPTRFFTGPILCSSPQSRSPKARTLPTPTTMPGLRRVTPFSPPPRCRALEGRFSRRGP